MRLDVRRRIAVGLAALVVATGCGAPGDDASGSALEGDAPFDLGGCVSADEAALSWYDDGTVRAGVGVVEGDGDAGVVISYERSVCPWRDVAERLAGEGLTVLLYERLDDFHPSEYLPGMVGLLRDREVARIGLLGGSIGGMASIESATEVDPPVDAVVSVSGADAATTQQAPELTVPLLQLVARDDEPFAEAARSTDNAAGAQHELMVVRGNAHGSVLLSSNARTEDRLVAFLVDTLRP